MRRNVAITLTVAALITIGLITLARRDDVTILRPHDLRPATSTPTTLANELRTPPNARLIGTIFPRRALDRQTQYIFDWSALLLAQNPTKAADYLNEQSSAKGYDNTRKSEAPTPADCERDYCILEAKAPTPITVRPPTQDLLEVGAAGLTQPPDAVPATTDRHSGASRGRIVTLNRGHGPPLTFDIDRDTHLILVIEGIDLGPTLEAVLRVSRNPAAVMRRYRAAAIAQNYSGASDRPIDTWKHGNYRVTQDGLYCGGGCGHYQATLVAPNNGTAYLHLRVSVRT